MNEIENPVEISIKVSNLSQIVGGILRTGDMIDISIINATTNKNMVVLENVYVTKTMTGEGERVGQKDEAGVYAENVIIDKENEKILNDHLNLGTVRLCKHL